MVSVYGNTQFDTTKLYTLVDGGSNGCHKMWNLRKVHHDMKKGLAVLLSSSTCSYKTVVQNALEAGAELVILYMEFDDDDIKDY